MPKRPVLGAAIGDCVHVAGVINFLNVAEELGFNTIFLGPAVSIDTLLAAIDRYDPQIVGVGYRLTPQTCANLLQELTARVRARPKTGPGPTWLFGGTQPTVEAARDSGLFTALFDSGSSPAAVIAFFRNQLWRAGRGEGPARSVSQTPPPSTLVERIAWKQPYPLIRHHFGQPTVAATVNGAAEIAAAACLDVLSLGTDQNAQEHFFRPAEMDTGAGGAGGVPVRHPDDLSQIYAASRRGNFPLVRCYSGTRDTHRWAAMLHETVQNAWCAIPLFWYTQLDGRSERPLAESIPETQALMAWHAQRNIPVEMNESHHWSLRDAPDVVAVVAAFLAAYNAKRAGVSDYVQQLMFNTPPNTSATMDLAKMLAKLELVEALQNSTFRIWRETRGGLTSYPADASVATGHLAATVFLQMQLKPHIVHVVGPTEATHAATAADVIHGCRVAEGAIRQALLAVPDLTADAEVQERKQQLLNDAAVLIDAIKALRPAGTGDPLTDPTTLARAVKLGLLDAPHLRGNPAARGEIRTGMINGACVAVNAAGQIISESKRVAEILSEGTEVAG